LPAYYYILHFKLTTLLSGTASSTCSETIALASPHPLDDSVWDLEGASWRLINVFAVQGGQFVGAYCPEQDFVEGMVELTRKKLVVESPTVEVAPLVDIEVWIAASQEFHRLQSDAETGGRRKRRLITHVPRRAVKIVKKWIRAHDPNCMVCDLSGQKAQRCYGCNLIAHKTCAQENNHNNVLWLPNGSMRWVCNGCYFDTHGGGP
jgi:hypothetical protein